MHGDAPAPWELEPFWAAVASEIAEPDLLELAAFIAADFPAPEPDLGRLVQLRRGICSAVAGQGARSYS